MKKIEVVAAIIFYKDEINTLLLDTYKISENKFVKLKDINLEKIWKSSY